jgi:NADH-quinone oxidoreductase subunit L
VFRLGDAHEPHFAWLQWLVAPLVAFVGIAAAYYLYVLYTGTPARISAALRPLQRLFEAKWGFDAAFDWVARRVVTEGSERILWKAVDTRSIDGAVNGVGALVSSLGRGMRTAQTGLVRGYALVMLGGAVLLLGYLLWLPR